MPEKTIEKRRRIGNTQGVLMIAVAGIIDGVQFLLNFIPFIGWILTALVSIFAWLTFFTWYKFNGIDFLDSILKFVTMFAVAVIEIIPVFNSIPAWIASVLVMLFIVRSEDVIFNKTGKNIQLKKAIKRMT